MTDRQRKSLIVAALHVLRSERARLSTRVVAAIRLLELAIKEKPKRKGKGDAS